MGRPKEFADKVEVKFTEEHLRFLDMLALATGASRSAVIRALVATAIKSTDWHDNRVVQKNVEPDTVPGVLRNGYNDNMRESY